MEVLHKSIEERDERFQEEQTIAKAGTTNQPNDDLQTLINERFDKIEENIDHHISTKIAENMQTMEVKDVEAKIDAASHQNKPYATLQTTLEASNLTNIRKETKNEERVHKQLRELRSANLIVYGVMEEQDNHMDLKGQDEKFITAFLDWVDVKT